MNNERDKFLAEAMGECWHDGRADFYDFGPSYCSLCKEVLPEDNPNDFSTWQGFGKLWEWCDIQDWFGEVIRAINHHDGGYCVNVSYINPDKFADVIYSYLK